jgi:hypothetical protein
LFIISLSFPFFVYGRRMKQHCVPMHPVCGLQLHEGGYEKCESTQIEGLSHSRKRFIVRGRMLLGNSMCCSAADSFHFICISYVHARAYGGQFILVYMGLQTCGLYYIGTRVSSTARC